MTSQKVLQDVSVKTTFNPIFNTQIKSKLTVQDIDDLESEFNVLIAQSSKTHHKVYGLEDNVSKAILKIKELQSAYKEVNNHSEFKYYSSRS